MCGHGNVPSNKADTARIRLALRNKLTYLIANLRLIETKHTDENVLPVRARGKGEDGRTQTEGKTVCGVSADVVSG